MCPRSQGFWKNHPGDWPVSTLRLGDEAYSATELMGLLRTPPRGDARIILAHQLVAAKLSRAAGAEPDGIDATIGEADVLLSPFNGKLPYGVGPSTPEGQAMVAVAGALDVYVNRCASVVTCTFPGTIGPGSGIELLPQDTGTIFWHPEFGLIGPAPVADLVQSTYFKTTPQNREFRRGFIEFGVPAFGGTLLAASLVLTETRGTSPDEAPADMHELTAYAGDLVVTVDDFNVTGTPVASFLTDVNEPTQMFTFDVTAEVRAAEGACLGFRVKLAVDPTFNADAGLGSAFGEYGQVTSPRLVLTLV